MTQSPIASPAIDCAIMLKQAGTAGANTITSTPTIPASASVSATGNSNSNGGITNTNSGVSSTSNDGLGTGAKAGIGIGIALAVLIIVILGFLLWRSRRSKNALSTASDDRAGQKAELDGTAIGGNGQELEGKNEQEKPFLVAGEMDGGNATHELGTGNAAYEMPDINQYGPVELEASHGRSEMGATLAPGGHVVA